MDVRAYLATKDASDYESDWLDFTAVSIPSGQMAIADPTLYPDGLVVPVRSGRYQIQVTVRTESGHHAISRLRASCASSNSIGSNVGMVTVDFARLGIGDNPSIAEIAKAITPEMAEPIWQSQETDELFGVVPWNVEAGVLMPFVTSGDGDGDYEVHELLEGEERVGVQIDFFAGME